VAKYSRYELERAAAQGRRIGSWNGVEVYACSKYDYNASDRNYWVLYDDNNKLVYGGYVHGNITEKGNVNECKEYWYNVPRKKGDVVVKTTGATSGYSDQVVTDEFFSRIDREINELLDNVKNMEFTV
jgi:hypothetical protein